MLELAKQEKPVSRIAVLITDNREEPRAIDSYVVSLYPNGTLGFRGCRRSAESEVRVPLAACLTLALEAEAHAAGVHAGTADNRSRGLGRTTGRKRPCTTRKPMHRAATSR